MSTYYKATFQDKEVLVKVEWEDDYYDDSPLDWSDPEKDHRPLFVLTNHKRYILGDRDAEDTAWRLLRQTAKWQDSWLEEYLDDGEDNPDYLENNLGGILDAAERVDAHVYPVYMYDHSGIALSLRNGTYPFNCPWDAGILGLILWTQEEQAKYGGSEDARAVVESYFNEYNAYVRGDVYCLSIIDPTEELKYLDARQDVEKGTHTLDDCSPSELEFCARGYVLETCGGCYFNDKYTPEMAAKEMWGVENMEAL